MSKKKGVSLDEKRQRMLQIFYEKKEFFTLKDLEKIAPKEKGIVQQSVKDVVQALVDDGHLDSDKVGTSVFFWTFPSTNVTILEEKIAESNKKLVEAEFKLDKLKAEYESEKLGETEAEQLQGVLTEINSLKDQAESLKSQIARYADMDPEVIAGIKEKAELYKDAVNTWTDNIFAIQSWCNKTFDIPREKLNKEFNIPTDLDYVE